MKASVIHKQFKMSGMWNWIEIKSQRGKIDSVKLERIIDGK